jgi:hypothetical protein
MIDSSTLPDTTEEDGENELPGDEDLHRGPVDFRFLNIAYLPGKQKKHSLNCTVF